jgi:hypothetical protein
MDDAEIESWEWIREQRCGADLRHVVLRLEDGGDERAEEA